MLSARRAAAPRSRAARRPLTPYDQRAVEPIVGRQRLLTGAQLVFGHGPFAVEQALRDAVLDAQRLFGLQRGDERWGALVEVEIEQRRGGREAHGLARVVQKRLHRDAHFFGRMVRQLGDELNLRLWVADVLGVELIEE